MKTPASTPLQDERFLLLEALGHGAMGSVYRAYDSAEQRLVALKVPSAAEPPGPAHSLSTEFDTWHRLRHRNIVRAYALRQARSGPIKSGTPYLVLEHVHGGPIHRAPPPGRLDDAAAEAVARQLLDALDLVHRAGFVHRDLKPGNVLTCDSAGSVPRVRLTDFGLAAPIGTAREPGVFSGSLPYVAPEALLGRPLDGRADFYGLGILLYRLTTGAMPCASDEPGEILGWHLAGSPADPREVKPGMSRRLARFVRRLTARDREDRPASAEEALGLLGTNRPAAAESVSNPVGRGTRANLRLCLDATRLGAARLFRLPADLDAAEALLTEVSVWTQVRGIELHRVEATAAGIARLVLRLAADRGDAGAEQVRRLGLDRALPMDWLGNLPIFDPRRIGDNPGGPGRTEPRPAARGICEFVWWCASERSMVVSFDTDRRHDALGLEVERRLAANVDRVRDFSRKRGGLLLVSRGKRARAA